MSGKSGRMDLSLVTARDLDDARWLASDVRARIEERLYRAVLTSTRQQSGAPSGPSGAWPADVQRQWIDVLGALEAGPNETEAEAKARIEANAKRPRYQPTARDLSVWLDDLGLIAGFGTRAADATGDFAALVVAEETLTKTMARASTAAARVSGLEDGSVACATAHRPRALSSARAEQVAADEALKRAKHRCEALAQSLAKGDASLTRQAFGVLKGAAHYWWLGAQGTTLGRWQWAARWAGLDTPAKAKALHDRVVLFAMVRDQRRTGKEALV
jgi:hypothetical protein